MKRKVTYTKAGVKYSVGDTEFPRFKWKDLYTVLGMLKNQVEDEYLHEIITAMMGSKREVVHKILWDLMEHASKDRGVKNNPNAIVCLWVISCYGYLNSLPVPNGKSWPKPSTTKSPRKVKVMDWKDGLKCPLCLRPFIPHKRWKSRDYIVQLFKQWLIRHLDEPH